MGLFSKNKTSKRASLLQPLKHTLLHYRSESSVTETSEFLLTASALSYSSQDSQRKEQPKPLASRPGPGPYSALPAAASRSQPPATADTPNFYRHSSYMSAKPLIYPGESQATASRLRLDLGTHGSFADQQRLPSMEFGNTSHDLGASFSDVDTSSEYESELDAAKSHPYYEQWKQYYRALAAAKQAPRAQDPPAMPPHRRTLSPRMALGLAERMVRSPDWPAHAESLASPPPPHANFQHGFNMSHKSSVLRKSRQSTIRSTRSFSTSQLSGTNSRIDSASKRAISVNVATEGPQRIERDEETTEDFSCAKPLSSMRANPTLLAHGLLELALDDLAISDYEAFFFNESGELDEQLKNDQNDQNQNDNTITPSPVTEQAPQDQMTPNAASTILPPELLSGSDSALSRASTRDSAKSFNSLQSEKKFKVGGSRRIVRTESNRSKGSRFVPPMAGPPPPQFPSAPAVAPPYGDRNFARHSIASIPMQNAAYLQQIQQQIQQLQQLQQLLQMQMPVYSNGVAGFRSSPSPPPPLQAPRSSDSTINAAIDEFLHLRNIIASGNKTLEYRLKWVKMLLEACNYKLYSYINIRGQSIPTDQSHANRQFFIKSFLNHLHKLLKELDGLHDHSDIKILAEACYIQGCLFKQEYVYKYDQDFGVPQDFEEAERYLLRCVDLHPGFFKAHFQLGDLYEQQNTDERYELAMMHYKESARMGFNRAIYQVAMLCLTDARSRLTKFFKYLRNLSETDMNSKEIVLNSFDRNELEEVVGLALFQLGKIYEGIYPGNVTIEDEFVKDCLQIAPVNYAKSLSYYNRAAKLHCLQAQVKLGLVYENGELNRRYNPNKSIQWFIKASTSPLKFKRHPEALLGISRWFMKGSDNACKFIPSPDVERAVMWCERAIREFNYPEAYYVMGVYAQMGYVQGSPKEWFDNAFSLGYQPPEASPLPAEANLDYLPGQEGFSPAEESVDFQPADVTLHK